MVRLRQRVSSLRIEQFKPLSDDAAPCLLLGIHYTHADFRSDYGAARDYRFKRVGPRWDKLTHRTGLSRHHFWICTQLTPTVVAIEGMRQLQKYYHDSGIGAVSPATLDQLDEYRRKLRGWMGADANRSHSLFEEGLLPIDLEHLRRLTVDTFPAQLDDFIEWESGFERACNATTRWNLAVVFPC